MNCEIEKLNDSEVIYMKNTGDYGSEQNYKIIKDFKIGLELMNIGNILKSMAYQVQLQITLKKLREIREINVDMI